MMSLKTLTQLRNANGKFNAGKALMILGILAVSTAPSFADSSYYDGPQPGPRAFRGEMMAPVNPYCAPATGAQVLGGFAADGQWVDVRTGFACGRW